MTVVEETKPEVTTGNLHVSDRVIRQRRYLNRNNTKRTNSKNSIGEGVAKVRRERKAPDLPDAQFLRVTWSSPTLVWKIAAVTGPDPRLSCSRVFLRLSLQLSTDITTNTSKHHVRAYVLIFLCRSLQ